ncbi:Aurachin C monooxygenase/isomerase [Baekduia alba]|uniref:FAD-dependent monooxygenase n=1 Tax=Baekduia alba TaxID=2997333 RepID=UPI0023413CCF|nr:FAD-dependent monooxygenase [Baekduia alba]WCB93301.1 Aurachin C monooxygenase/isomerase [Baekduia alba]
MADIQKALVVGGGIGGLTAAIALRGIGVDVDLVEKNPRWDVYGVGIIQPPNALRALDALGLAEACVAAGHPILGGRNHLADGTVVANDDYPPVDPRFPPMNGLTRPALHEILKSRLRDEGVAVRLGEVVSQLTQRTDGVTVAFSDGTTEDYDLVIGADGLYSQTRTMLFGDELRPRYTGQTAWRYNAPRIDGLDRIHIYIGGEGGTAGLVPLSDSLMYVLYITKWPQDRLKIPAEELPALMRSRLEIFGGEIADVREQITDPEGVVFRPVDNILVPRPWYRGRVLLIGDAAHGTSPHAGQGAAQAVEDALVLTQELEGGGGIDAVLERFMDRRFERCKAVVELSASIGAWEQNPDPSIDPNDIRHELIALCAQPV